MPLSEQEFCSLRLLLFFSSSLELETQEELEELSHPFLPLLSVQSFHVPPLALFPDMTAAGVEWAAPTFLLNT